MRAPLRHGEKEGGREGGREEKEKLDFEVERLEKKLSNEKFVSKAPKDVVDKEKEKLENYKELLDKTIKRLEELK